MSKNIIGVRFYNSGKIYHFDASHFPDISTEDHAIVETRRGMQLGKVVLILQDPKDSRQKSWKRINRIASPRDLVMKQIWQKKELEALINCRSITAEMNIKGVKIVSAEYSIDGKDLFFLYTTQSDSNKSIKELIRSVQKSHSRTKISFKYIGPRDTAKIIGGMGACGLDNRCCSLFLTEFSPVSIRMAKAQGISLNPAEITGMCGRLKCCLVYEYDAYIKARKNLPKKGKKVITPNGEGTVTDSYPLQQIVSVKFEPGDIRKYQLEDIQPYNELQALKGKANEPCPKHGTAGCTCQNRS